MKQPDVKQPHGNALDMFSRINFPKLRTTVDSYTSNEDDTIKAGLKQNVYYLLKRSAKTLRALLLEEEKEDAVKEVSNFVELLEVWDDIMFGDAVYETNKRREIFLRKPEQLPNEDDMAMIRTHILTRMENLTNKFEFFTKKEFVELRDIVLSRLIIINGRRDGEPSRLLIDDWKGAKEDVWIDKENLTFLDDFDQALVKSLKVTYITGKGTAANVLIHLWKNSVGLLLAQSDMKYLILVQLVLLNIVENQTNKKIYTSIRILW